MTLGQRLKLHFRITCDLQAQFTRKIIGQGLFFADQNLLTGAIFLLQTDRRAVITLQGGAGGLVEACRSLAHVRRKFRVFQKEWNERQAQACLVAFRQFSDEAGGCSWRDSFSWVPPSRKFTPRTLRALASLSPVPGRTPPSVRRIATLMRDGRSLRSGKVFHKFIISYAMIHKKLSHFIWRVHGLQP